MHFQANPISFKPPCLKGLSARLIASGAIRRLKTNYGRAVRRLQAIRAELAAIQRLRERGIDAVALSGDLAHRRPSHRTTQ